MGNNKKKDLPQSREWIDILKREALMTYKINESLLIDEYLENTPVKEVIETIAVQKGSSFDEVAGSFVTACEFNLNDLKIKSEDLDNALEVFSYVKQGKNNNINYSSIENPLIKTMLKEVIRSEPEYLKDSNFASEVSRTKAQRILEKRKSKGLVNSCIIKT